MSDKVQVAILAGGLGMRLREQTEFRPKPMVEVAGKPILWHIMKIYSQYGFDDFTVCLGYMGEFIKDYFYHYAIRSSDIRVHLGHEDHRVEMLRKGDSEPWTVSLVDTGIRTMTGGRLKRIEPYIDADYLMVTYGDGVANVDLGELLAFHKSHGKVATVTGVQPPSRFGQLTTDENHIVTEFSEKPVMGDSLINGGFFCFSLPKFFDYVSADESCVFEREPLENLARDRELAVFEHRDFWQCMDTLRDVQLLNEIWNSGNPPWKVWD